MFKKSQKKYLKYAVLSSALFLGVAGITASSTKVKADDSVANALKSAPLGVSLSDGSTGIKLFEPGTIKGGLLNISNVNDASVKSSTNSDSAGTDVLIINQGDSGAWLGLGSAASLGTMWSTNINRFDLNKDQTVSMWVYFGNRGSKAGSGMAFVVQNDPNPTSATGYSGGALGVYGSDSNRGVAGIGDSAEKRVAGAAKEAVQNSFAIEYDTQSDSTKGTGTGWDVISNDGNAAFPSGHMAATYPADTSAYNGFTYNYLGSHPYLAINHTELGGFLKPENTDSTDTVIASDGQWRHTTVHYDSANQTMTYSINDKKLDGEDLTHPDYSDPKHPYFYKSVTVPFDKSKIFAKEGETSAATGKVRYGFTGATASSAYETNAVVFDKVPNVVDADGAVKVVDKSKNGKVLKAGDEVSPGDELTYTYDLSYLGGLQSWQNIRTTATLASEMQQDGNNLFNFQSTTDNPTAGTVTYRLDSNILDTVTLNMQNGGNLTPNTNTVKYTLNSNLSGSSKNGALLTFTGKVGDKTDDNEDVFADATPAIFQGNNHLLYLTPPDFYVRTKKDMALEVDPNERVTPDVTDQGATTVFYEDENAVLSPHVSFPKDDATNNFNPDNVTMDVTLNGTLLDPSQYKIVVDPNGTGADDIYQVQISNSMINIGENNVKVKANYTGDSHSNEVNYVVTKKPKDSLKFGDVSDQASFVGGNLEGHTDEHKRDSDWKLSVADGRLGTTTWNLYAESTDFMNEDQEELIGTPIFNDGTNSSSIQGQSALVASSTTSEEFLLTDIIKDVWNEQTGVKLETTSKTKPGSYYGTITWTLADVPS
ncbi:lectin-like domain-containing protein [Companilactobacillus metriopterae]|uniref:lectin-like domain-containing protein n=1 Tax=Companilactobacillus metriopterae TaxID=1909267 RepID=UPI00100AC10F|nr:hypothetical protein [Companilactobacillus metriopterae]